MCGYHEQEQSDALSRLREKLTGDAHRKGEGNVTFTRTDGAKVTLKNVRVDSISPSAEARGVIGVEYFDNSDVVHVPFVESWVIDYDF
jgi:hypothetical protein